jgi:hypothetical protein
LWIPKNSHRTKPTNTSGFVRYGATLENSTMDVESATTYAEL